MNEVNSASSKHRPFYETEANRAQEREAIEQVEFQFDSEITQTGKGNLVDGIMKKGGIVWAYLELKCRKVEYQSQIEDEGYMISVIKWDRLRSVVRGDKPVLLVVTFGDEAYGLWIDPKQKYPTRMAGRYQERQGRTRTEYEKMRDKEVCYFIPWKEFLPLWNMN